MSVPSKLDNVTKVITLTQLCGDWTRFFPAAGAAVLVLREPSDEMLEAALPGLPDGDMHQNTGGR